MIATFFSCNFFHVLDSRRIQGFSKILFFVLCFTMHNSLFAEPKTGSRKLDSCFRIQDFQRFSSLFRVLLCFRYCKTNQPSHCPLCFMHSSLFTELRTDSREVGLLFFRFFRDSCLLCVLQNPTDHPIACTPSVLCTIVCLKNPKTDSSKLDSCFWFWKYRLYKCWKGRGKNQPSLNWLAVLIVMVMHFRKGEVKKGLKNQNQTLSETSKKNSNDLFLSSNE